MDTRQRQPEIDLDLNWTSCLLPIQHRGKNTSWISSLHCCTIILLTKKELALLSPVSLINGVVIYFKEPFALWLQLPKDTIIIINSFRVDFIYLLSLKKKYKIILRFKKWYKEKLRTQYKNIISSKTNSEYLIAKPQKI